MSGDAEPGFETYDLVTRVMEETWQEAIRTLGGSPSDPLALWAILAKRVLIAAADGERDSEVLKRIALRGLDG